MTITLWNLFEASLLCLNAVCILHEERFLVKIGWSAKSPTAGGFGESPTAKAQILNLIHSIRTVARKLVCYQLLTEPHIIQDAVTDIVLSYCDELIENTNNLQANQIISPIIVCSPLSHITTALHTLHAIIVEITIPQKYIRTSSWKCKNGICVSLKPLISKYKQSIKPLCPHCASDLEEIASSRDYGTNTFLKILNPKFLVLQSNCNTRNMGELRLARVDDDKNCGQELELGNELLLTGVLNKDCFEIWGCETVDYYSRKFGDLTKINQIRKRYGVNPWAFVHILANEIANSLYPPNSFIHLRMGILLSLASTHTSKPIPILATGKDVHIAEEIMFKAASLSLRCTRPCLPTVLGGQIKDGWKRAGSMLLASKGVCYLGRWEGYTGHRSEAIRNAVETGLIVLDNNNSVKMRAAVWSCYEQSDKKKDEEHNFSLMKVFGWTWKIEAEADLDMQDAIIDFILSDRSTYKPKIPEEEFRNYLQAVNSIQVTLSNSALNLLQHYFVCARRARGDNLPLSSLNLLTSLTEAHARLNQRAVAWREDALVALHLCEIALGPCHGILNPPPSQIWEFGNWLEENILSLVPLTLS